MKPEPITMSELAAEWDALGVLRGLQRRVDESRADEVPPGWITREEYAIAARMSTVNAGKILAAAERAGLIEAREFRVATGRGVRSIKHYPRPK